MQADEVVKDIRIAWSEDYEWKKRLLQGLSASKGELLSALKPIVTRMVALGDFAEQMFVAYVTRSVSEEEFATKMTLWQPEVSELYDKSGDLPMPPEDMKSYDEVCASLFATVDNLFLPFGESTRTQVSSRQRDLLLAGQFERYAEQRKALEYEERKMH
ncbi:MAG: hypothetical protein JWM27_1593 [Gemmatimonadetes bacterium]|nr:hypothetical protein [Gemmatimonadota bacterium]